MKLAADRTAKARLKLTQAGRKLLKHAHGHKLKATLTISSGHRKHRVTVKLALKT